MITFLISCVLLASEETSAVVAENSELKRKLREGALESASFKEAEEVFWSLEQSDLAPIMRKKEECWWKGRKEELAEALAYKYVDRPPKAIGIGDETEWRMKALSRMTEKAQSFQEWKQVFLCCPSRREAKVSILFKMKTLAKTRADWLSISQYARRYGLETLGNVSLIRVLID